MAMRYATIWLVTRSGARAPRGTRDASMLFYMCMHDWRDWRWQRVIWVRVWGVLLKSLRFFIY
jgi:hypothetical protein